MIENVSERDREKERDLKKKWRQVGLLHDEKLECKLIIYFIEGTRYIYCRKRIDER